MTILAERRESTSATGAEPTASRRLELEPDHDAIGTLRAVQILHTPAFRVRAHEAWYATREPDGPATLHAVQTGATLTAEAWGPGGPTLLARLEELVGVTDTEARPFLAALAENGDEPLRSLAKRFPGLRTARTRGLLDLLVQAVLAQKVLGKEAGWSLRRLTRAHGERAPGPWDAGTSRTQNHGGSERAWPAPLWLLPQPPVLQGLGYETYHRYGIERQRAERVRRVAAWAERLEPALEMPRAQAYGWLMNVPGVGLWTAAKVLGPAWGDADAVPVGDFNLPSLVTWNLAGEPRGSDERMLDLLEPFRGHRGRVLRLLQRGGKGAPRRGPRLGFRRVELA